MPPGPTEDSEIMNGAIRWLHPNKRAREREEAQLKKRPLKPTNIGVCFAEKMKM